MAAYPCSCRPTPLPLPTSPSHALALDGPRESNCLHRVLTDVSGADSLMVLDGDVTDGGEEPTVRAQAQLTNSRPDAPLTRDDISPGVALKLLLVSCVLVSFTRDD